MSLATKQIAAGHLVDAIPSSVGLTVISETSDWFETMSDKGADRLELSLTVENAFVPAAGISLEMELYESDDHQNWSHVTRLSPSPAPIQSTGNYKASHPMGSSPKKYFKVQFTLDENPASGSLTPYPGAGSFTFDGSCWVSVWKAQ